MPEAATTDLFPRIALYGLFLNTVWEYAQLGLFYDCWTRWRPWQRAAVPALCILGDVVIVLVVVVTAVAVAGGRHIVPPDAVGVAVLVGIGFVLGMVLERAALALRLWSYRLAMPTLSVAGRPVGLLPVLQITLLPPLSLWLAL